MTYGVLWDLDGVLADSGPFHFPAWSAAFESLGVPFTQDMFNATFGMNNTSILKLFLGPDTPQELMDRISDEKELAFRQVMPGKLQPLPGIRALLAALQQAGFRQAIGSSAPQANIDAEVDTLGLRPYFQAIVSAEKFPGKPDPWVYLTAAARIGLPPERCLVIEDAVPGVQAAKNAGMRCIAVTNTNTAAALSAADLVVDSLATISVETIRRLLEGGAGQI
jgi:HAD superfamily hydrolase (TIGR01509 family)